MIKRDTFVDCGFGIVVYLYKAYKVFNQTPTLRGGKSQIMRFPLWESQCSCHGGGERLQKHRTQQFWRIKDCLHGSRECQDLKFFPSKHSVFDCSTVVEIFSLLQYKINC